MNGRTISQGFSSNGGSSFYQTYYNNQFNNGLPNSKGYPMNLRKISLVNGSLSGLSFGTNSQKVLDLDGFVNHPLFTLVVGRVSAWTLPAYNNSGNVSELFEFGKGVSKPPMVTNYNARGNMDIVPGGSLNGYDQIAESVLGSKIVDWTNDWVFSFPILAFGAEWEERVNAKVHSFIPSYSALGIKQPEQDWSQPLTRNLVCSNETPFDSYYGTGENTKHTSFTCESVAWMLKELDGQPQAPMYPFSAELHGPATVCNLNQNFTVTFGNSSLCKFPTPVTWTLSANLVLVSSDDNSIVVKAVSGGEALVVASLGTGQSYSYPVYIGALPSNVTILGMQNTNTGITSSTVWTFSAPKFTGANYFWFLSSGKKINTDKSNFLELLVPCGVKLDVQCKIINNCGMISLSNTITTTVGYCKHKRDAGINTFYINQPIEAPRKLNISVATISSELFGHLFYDKESLADEMIQRVNVYNKKGEQVMQISTLDTKNTQLDFTDQQDGTYFIEVFGKNDFRELHTFYYSQLNQEEYILDNIAGGSIVINSDRATDRLYVMQQKLFNDLQSDRDAIDASSTLKEFVSENATSSFGYIWLVQNALGKDDIANAEQLIDKWQTTNTIDQNFKNYYQFYIKVVNNKSLSESENEILHVIAQGCPLVDGEIVYAARDLYSYLNPDDLDNYVNSCSSIGLKASHQDITNEAIIKNTNIIYPNPTKGNITIDNLDYGAKNIVITDIYGKVILLKTTTSQLLNLQLNTKGGVYFITISNNRTGKSETQKLIIHN
jgi:hypothetical protein